MMPIPTSQQRRTAPSEIPDKLYFRIGEVARICEVPAYVLRFWETEFQQLKPNKGGTGQRLYRRRDVEMCLRIKRLLYDQGYTIPGARQVFQTEAREFRKKNSAPELPLAVASSNHADAALSKVKKELRELAGILASPIGSPRTRPGRSTRPAEKPTGLFEL
ncbi:Transcriptional regulator, MerR family [Acidisarcina polymorpha]|uniref:Transcriptional regulator, MerR family n=2 Tax=Acidisarcina polymorpha TaxID=2211140 RepID=A0A2Z5FXC9_9BACT|nr:Transcriptional regulator, MerR family [Acidisarcina polymorpha]